MTRTLRARVARATFLLLALVLGVAALVIDEGVRESTRRSFDRRLLAEAEALASQLRADRTWLDYDLDPAVLTAYVSSSGGAYCEIWTGGRVVARSPSLEGRSLPPPDPDLLARLPHGEQRSRKRSVDASVGRVRLAMLVLEHPLGDHGAPVAVVVARRYEEFAAYREPVRHAMALAIPLALIVGTIGVFVVARRATAPIEKLGRDAREIGGASLARRLDVTRIDGELGELATTLNEAFDRLAEAVERERRFASNVAHELRTPVSVVRSTLELALLRERSSEEYRAALAEALAGTERLEKIVAALLLLGRAEAGTLPLEPVDLVEVTERAIAPLRPLADGAGVPLRVSTPATPVLVRGNACLLERLVANLVENALTHGGSPAGVDVFLGASADGRIALAVLDRGPGFPEGFAGHAFERFARGDASRSRATGGAGLGLAISRAIARAHSGELAAAPREGGGLALRFLMPAS